VGGRPEIRDREEADCSPVGVDYRHLRVSHVDRALRALVGLDRPPGTA